MVMKRILGFLIAVFGAQYAHAQLPGGGAYFRPRGEISEYSTRDAFFKTTGKFILNLIVINERKYTLPEASRTEVRDLLIAPAIVVNNLKVDSTDLPDGYTVSDVQNALGHYPISIVVGLKDFLAELSPSYSELLEERRGEKIDKTFIRPVLNTTIGENYWAQWATIYQYKFLDSLPSNSLILRTYISVNGKPPAGYYKQLFKDNKKVVGLNDQNETNFIPIGFAPGSLESVVLSKVVKVPNVKDRADSTLSAQSIAPYPQFDVTMEIIDTRETTNPVWRVNFTCSSETYSFYMPKIFWKDAMPELKKSFPYTTAFKPKK